MTAAGAGNEVRVEAVPKLSAGQEKGLCASLFTKSSENFCGLLANFNAAAKSFPFSVGSWTKVNLDDPILFFNAIDLIKNPGEWACQPLDDGTYKVAYLPRNAQELEQTQTHVRDTVVTIGILGRDICRNVRLEGLEIAGGSSVGIRANNVENLTISRCVIYNSGNAATVNGAGIFCDKCNHTRIESCIIFANMHGIGMTQGDGNVITGCEVAFNDNDGIDITGRKTMPEAPQTNATIDHNYFHHHIYLGHADNSQIWGNLEGFYFNHNLSIIGGQNLMTEECKKLRCSDSVMISAGARHVILGHENAFDAHFKNMIFMFGNFGSIGFSSNTTGVEVFDNVFYESKMIYGGVDPKGGRNLHFMPSGTNVLTCKVGDKVNSYKSPAELHAANGLEADSKVADPQFKNVPLAQFISAAPTKSTPNTLYFDPKKHSDAYPVMFAKVTAGDTVEVNADGVSRKVQSKGADFIVIDPPLPTAPHREVFVWYWGKKTDIKLDLSSPICNGKTQPGTPFNIAAYQRGELDGSGKRSLPELSEEAKTAWPEPCNYIYPCRIPSFNQVQAKGK